MPLFNNVLEDFSSDIEANLLISSEALRLSSKIRLSLNKNGYPGYTNEEWRDEFYDFLKYKHSDKHLELESAVFKAKVISLEESVDFSILELENKKPGYTSSKNIIKRATKNFNWCAQWKKNKSENKSTTSGPKI